MQLFGLQKSDNLRRFIEDFHSSVIIVVKCIT